MTVSGDYRRPAKGVHPEALYPGYGSTIKRAPTRPLVRANQTLSEITGPLFGHDRIGPTDHDLTKQHAGEPIGQRIVVAGRVLDEDERPVSHTLVEVWQANACGRYHHDLDQHDAPLDPNFTGAGRMMTDENGAYRFVTIEPGAYSWRNHHNGWRPRHIHFSLFGPSLMTRIVTQMYFPGDPLLPFDPIFNSVRDKSARDRLIARFELDLTVPEWALGYRFDIVLRGRNETPVLEP
jgi:protocatechuate 3,4-dioxygenase beta subunit